MKNIFGFLKKFGGSSLRNVLHNSCDAKSKERIEDCNSFTKINLIIVEMKRFANITYAANDFFKSRKVLKNNELKSGWLATDCSVLIPGHVVYCQRVGISLFDGCQNVVLAYGGRRGPTVLRI